MLFGGREAVVVCQYTESVYGLLSKINGVNLPLCKSACAVQSHGGHSHSRSALLKNQSIILSQNGSRIFKASG